MIQSGQARRARDERRRGHKHCVTSWQACVRELAWCSGETCDGQITTLEMLMLCSVLVSCGMCECVSCAPSAIQLKFELCVFFLIAFEPPMPQSLARWLRVRECISSAPPMPRDEIRESCSARLRAASAAVAATDETQGHTYARGLVAGPPVRELRSAFLARDRRSTYPCCNGGPPNTTLARAGHLLRGKQRRTCQRRRLRVQPKQRIRVSWNSASLSKLVNGQEP